MDMPVRRVEEEQFHKLFVSVELNLLLGMQCNDTQEDAAE